MKVEKDGSIWAKLPIRPYLKAIGVDHLFAEELADLNLHKQDLNNCLECLKQIEEHKLPATDANAFIRQALWTTAVVNFIKCFVNSDGTGRRQIAKEKIYSAKAGLADAQSYRDHFDEIKAIRDKHIIHDVSSWKECIPWSMLIDEKYGKNVEQVYCITRTKPSLSQKRCDTLKKLATAALDWIEKEGEKKQNALVDVLNKMPHAELASWGSPDLGPKDNIDDLMAPRKAKFKNLPRKPK